jgi:hypothetical protein
MDVHRSLVVKSLRSGQILLDLVGMVLVRPPPFLLEIILTHIDDRTMEK